MPLTTLDSGRISWTPAPDEYDYDWFGPPPAYALAHLERLQRDRSVNQQRYIDAGRLTQAEAQQRATAAAALVRLWRHFVDGTTFDVTDPVRALGADWSTIHADAAQAYAAAIERGKLSPTEDRLSMRYVLAFVEDWLRIGADGVPDIVVQRLLQAGV